MSGKRQLLKHRRDVHLNEKKYIYILGTRQLLKHLRDVVHLKKKGQDIKIYSHSSDSLREKQVYADVC